MNIEKEEMVEGEEEMMEREGDGRECVICYEKMDMKKNVCVTDCGHAFCFLCMMKHIQKNNGCPICRTLIFSYNNYDSDDDSEYSDSSHISSLNGLTRNDYPIELFVHKFIDAGYHILDALSLLMFNFSQTNPKYTKRYIRKLEQDIEDIHEQLTLEYTELNLMQAEDIDVSAN